MANYLICSKLWLKLKRYLCFEILNDKAIFLNESNNLLITILQTGLSFWVSPRLSSANLSRCARSTRASSSWTCNDFREERNGEKNNNDRWSSRKRWKPKRWKGSPLSNNFVFFHYSVLEKKQKDTWQTSCCNTPCKYAICMPYTMRTHVTTCEH